MKIDISYGNGGMETTSLINDIFLKYFDNPILRKMEDAAVLNTTEKIAFTTDSFVVKPLFFKGGDIGKLAVCGTVNDLSMVGATPKYLTCSFIIEEGLDINDLEKIVKSMAETAKEAKVIIVAGDTKVIEGNGGLYINTSGIGIFNNKPVSISNAKNGDVIILTGNLGDHHACILSERMEIENDIESDVAPLNKIAEILLKYNVHTMRDVTRGGLATVLNEVSNMSKVKVIINEESLPVSHSVKGLIGILGLDPLYMANEGKLIAILPEKYADKALLEIKKTKYGKNASLIGKIENGEDVVLNTRLSGSRKLNVQVGEGLPRIC